MATSLDIVTKVRTYVNDHAEDSFDDTSVENAIVVALDEVELDYPQGIVVDENLLFTPAINTPTETLIAIKAAIILTMGDNTKSSRESIYVKDGDSVVDTSKSAGGRAVSLNNLENSYERLLNSLFNNTTLGIGGSRVNMY